MCSKSNVKVDNCLHDSIIYVTFGVVKYFLFFDIFFPWYFRVFRWYSGDVFLELSEREVMCSENILMKLHVMGRLIFILNLGR